MHRNRISAGCWLAGMGLLAGCATVSSLWPVRKAAVVPQPVSELELQLSGTGAAPVVLQYWERNTLVVDLQNVQATGQVVLLRRAGRNWPARVAVRMAPQRFEVLEVEGAQRLLLPVASAGTGAVTAELSPGVHDQATPQLTISWGARDSF